MRFRNIGFFALLLICSFYLQTINAQFLRESNVRWAKDGNNYFSIEEGIVQQTDLKTGTKSTFISQQQLIPTGSASPIRVESFQLSNDNNKILIFTNTAKVWRYHTRGDYWVLDVKQHTLKQLGKNQPSQSLMFAKFSPDAENVGYVSEHNIIR